MTEQWRICIQNSNYEVSNLGCVRRRIDARGTRVGKVLKQDRQHGYRYVVLCAGSNRRGFYVHQLVAAAFIGPCPVGKEVNHKDLVKKNNRPSNLEYVTPSENILHAKRHGRRGGRNAKLRNCEIRKIRTLCQRGISQVNLARHFNVSFMTIWLIVHRRTWKDV
jgi:hypothetical protein